MERIGFGLRFGAGIIDALIILAVMAVLGGILGAGAFSMLGSMGQGVEHAVVAPSLIALLVMSLIPIAYSSLEIFKAQTPGKMALKLIIRNEDGSPAAQETLIKRWAFKNSSSLVSVLATLTGIGILQTLGSVAGLIVFVGCFFTLQAARQAFHDKFAKTAVFKTA